MEGRLGLGIPDVYANTQNQRMFGYFGVEESISPRVNAEGFRSGSIRGFDNVWQHGLIGGGGMMMRGNHRLTLGGLCTSTELLAQDADQMSDAGMPSADDAGVDMTVPIEVDVGLDMETSSDVGVDMEGSPDVSMPADNAPRIGAVIPSGMKMASDCGYGSIETAHGFFDICERSGCPGGHAWEHRPYSCMFAVEAMKVWAKFAMTGSA